MYILHPGYSVGQSCRFKDKQKKEIFKLWLLQDSFKSLHLRTRTHQDTFLFPIFVLNVSAVNKRLQAVPYIIRKPEYLYWTNSVRTGSRVITLEWHDHKILKMYVPYQKYSKLYKVLVLKPLQHINSHAGSCLCSSVLIHLHTPRKHRRQEKTNSTNLRTIPRIRRNRTNINISPQTSLSRT